MKYVVATLYLTLTTAACAGGLRLVTQDAFAAGRGEAFAATASNASAIYYNPAGLAFLDKAELRMSAYNLHFEPTFQNADTNEHFEIEENFAVAPSFFYSHPLAKGALKFGLGLYAPYGAAVEWPEDTGFWPVGHTASLEYIRLNPVIAWRVSEEFSVAAGLFLDYADLSTEQGLSQTAGPLPNNFRFEGEGWAVGYNLGLLWRPDSQWSLGLNFRSGSRVKLDGETDFFRVFNIPRETLPAEMELNFPLTAVFGISWRPNEKWNVEYNIDFTGWSSFDQTQIRQDRSPNSPSVPQDIDVNFGWEDSWIHSIGVTRQLGSEWHASLGYAFSQNSVPDTYYSPLVADLDRHFVTFGLGWRGEHWEFDVAYQHGFADKRKVEGSEPGTAVTGVLTATAADGTYDFTSHAVAISVGYRF